MRLKFQNLWRHIFIACQVEGYRNILKLSCRPTAFTSYKAFLKYKTRLGTSISPPYVHDVWRKIFLLLHSTDWPNFIVWLPLLREILDNICITIACWPGCNAIIFEINLKLVSAIFYQIFIFSPYDSPLKTMKNVFYFI